MDSKEEEDAAAMKQETDESLHEMTQSYSEISVDSDNESDKESFIFALQKVLNTKGRPKSLELQNERQADSNVLEYLHKDGTIEKNGDMIMYFSEDIEEKIKLSSPVSKQSNPLGYGDSVRSPNSCLYRQALEPSVPSLDVTILNELEADARKVATAVDSLTENLAGLLHSISALTVDFIETYRDAVCSTCDAVDSNIKSMYQLMAKCEELSKSLKPAYVLAEHVKEIRRLLDLFENASST